MPGFTSECQTGQHKMCADATCRCACHPWTQELMEAQKAPPPPASYSSSTVETACPRCGAKAKAGDFYCRKDGERLSKQCFACGAQEDPGDAFCWRCGLKSGEKPVEVLPPEELAETEDILLRLRRMALEKGLLKETAVP